jgi:hypothetical protein
VTDVEEEEIAVGEIEAAGEDRTAGIGKDIVLD